MPATLFIIFIGRLISEFSPKLPEPKIVKETHTLWVKAKKQAHIDGRAKRFLQNQSMLAISRMFNAARW